MKFDQDMRYPSSQDSPSVIEREEVVLDIDSETRDE